MEKYCTNCGRVFKDSDFKICPYCGQQLSTRVGRQPIPRQLRHQVFQRDGYRCRECGATKEETRLHIDHIKPISKGGTNDISNLQTLCEDCNRAKYTDEWIGGSLNNHNYSSTGYYRKYCLICEKTTKFVGKSKDDKMMYCSVCYNILGTPNKYAKQNNNSTSVPKYDAHEIHLKKIEEENKMKKELLSRLSFGDLSTEFNHQIEIFGDDPSINKSKKQDLINYFLDNYTLSDLKDMFD